jgi:hypothetical protein
MTSMEDAHAPLVGVGADRLVGMSPSVASNDTRDLHRLLVDPGGCGFDGQLSFGEPGACSVT